MMSVAQLYDWFWIVGGDQSRAWSSKAGAYVATWPADRTTRIASEAELVEVMANLGLEGPLSLTAARTAYRAKVDADAEAVRLRYITPGAGMALTYQEKFAQAQGVVAMGAQAANALSIADRDAQFPTLSASVGIEGATIFECAELVLEKYAEFAALSHVIERTRLTGKQAIGLATDVAGVRTAYEAIAWPQT